MGTRELGPSLWVTLLGHPGEEKERDIDANVALIREEKTNALFGKEPNNFNNLLLDIKT